MPHPSAKPQGRKSSAPDGNRVPGKQRTGKREKGETPACSWHGERPRPDAPWFSLALSSGVRDHHGHFCSPLPSRGAKATRERPKLWLWLKPGPGGGFVPSAPTGRCQSQGRQTAPWHKPQPGAQVNLMSRTPSSRPATTTARCPAERAGPTAAQLLPQILGQAQPSSPKSGRGERPDIAATSKLGHGICAIENGEVGAPYSRQ